MMIAGIAMSSLLVLGQPLLYLAAIPGMALALAILRSPTLGLYLVAVTLPLDVAGNVLSVTQTFNISIAWIFTLLTLLAWAVHLLMYRQLPVWPREVSILVLYLVAGAVSLTSAAEFDRGAEEIVRVSQTILFFLMAINLVRTRSQLKTTVALLVIASVCTFAYAILQKHWPSNIIQERSLDLLRPGAVTYGVELGKVDTQGYEHVERVTGTTVHSGVLALDCAYLLPFMMAYLQMKRSLAAQFAGWGAVLITFGAFATTLSRSGFLTFGFTLVMLTIVELLKITGARFIAIVVILLLALPFVPEGYIERVLSPSSYLRSNSDSLNGRLEMWAASLQAIFDHPLRGFGIGNEHGIFDYWKPELREMLGTVMNTFLQIAMEVGIFGLILFLAFVFMIFRRVFMGRALFIRLGEPDMVIIGTAFLVLLSALLLSWMTVEFLRASFKNIWLLLACVVAYNRIGTSSIGQLEAARGPLRRAP
jgi:O-antigen ligase